MIPDLRMSIGTAMVLGLKDGRLPVPPTTAYLMVGDECVNNCAFCTQAREADSGGDLLSRVIWPRFDTITVLESIEKAWSVGIRRICLQCLIDPKVMVQLPYLVKDLKAHTNLEISCSISAVDRPLLEMLHTAGASRVGIALDGASKRIFKRIKGSDVGNPYTWDGNWRSLRSAVRIFGRGNVSTHIIVGLGETDEEIVRTIIDCQNDGIMVSLFAYTPMKGTKEIGSAPSLGRYRALQIARSLIMDHGVISGFSFDKVGKLVEVPSREVDGSIVFQTRGCPDCNRPYYNERPRGPMYNYPRQMDGRESDMAMNEARGYMRS